MFDSINIILASAADVPCKLDSRNFMRLMKLRFMKSVQASSFHKRTIAIFAPLVIAKNELSLVLSVLLVVEHQLVHRAVFNSMSKVIFFCFNFSTFSPSKSETKTNRKSLADVSGNFACSFGWFTKLSVSIVICESNYFRSCFKTLIENRSNIVKVDAWNRIGNKTV